MRIGRLLIILIAALAVWAAPPQAAPKAQQKTEQKAPKAEIPSAGLIDINSASEQVLRQLPGIGEAYAAKIVAARPYRAKNELVQKKIIPQATYDKIKDQIIAKQVSAKKK